MPRIDTDTIAAKTILLDIDGTLSPAGSDAVSDDIAAAVARLKERNEVYLLSNKRLPERNTRMAASLRIPLIITGYRKPDPRVLRGITLKYRELIVIGDKVLTDGLLALFLGARFIRVPRLRSPREPLLDSIFNAIDDVAREVSMLVLLMRPAQWVKNGLVFVPLFFASHLSEGAALGAATAVFAGLCFFASAGYILNDFFDRAHDALHPLKRHRPLAAGALHPYSALACALLLVVSGGWVFFVYAQAAMLFAILYLLSSLAYSAVLKDVPIIETFLFIWFYLARVLMGGIAAGVVLSSWLTLAIVFLALFLISGKRYAQWLSGRLRTSLSEYPPQYLSGMLSMSAGLVIAFYGVYSVLGTTSSIAVYSTIPVTLSVMRYLQLTLKGEGAEYPEKLVFKDAILLFAAAVWFLCMLAVFY